MKKNLYQILGLIENATYEEVKSAYYQLRSRHLPEQDLNTFKKIRNAYETLSDSQSREDYDSLDKYSNKITNLFKKVNELMNREEWSQAIKELKRILIFNSNLSAARNLLGICYLNNQQYQKAVGVFEKVIKSAKNVPGYWINLGHAYLDLTFNNQDESYYSKAKKAFKTAIEKGAINNTPYLRIAGIYRKAEEYSKAIEWAEKVINVDNKVGLDDFWALISKCKTYIVSDQLNKLKKIVNRIVSLVKEKEWNYYKREIKDYVVKVLMKMSYMFFQKNYFQVATILSEAALKLKSNSEIEKLYKKSNNIAEAFEEWQKLNKNNIIAPIKQFINLNLFKSSEENHYNYNEIIKKLNNYSPKEISNSIEIIEESAPNIYNLIESFFQDLKKQIKKEEKRRTAKSNRKSNSANSNNNDESNSESSCAVLFLVMIVIFILAILGY
ncbi:MAG: DnaJ domain-containing protein [Bacillota bacterium]